MSCTREAAVSLKLVWPRVVSAGRVCAHFRRRSQGSTCSYDRTDWDGAHAQIAAREESGRQLWPGGRRPGCRIGESLRSARPYLRTWNGSLRHGRPGNGGSVAISEWSNCCGRISIDWRVRASRRVARSILGRARCFYMEASIGHNKWDSMHRTRRYYP